MRLREKLLVVAIFAWAAFGPIPQRETRHASQHGRNKPPPKWLRLTPWESWRPVVWKRTA